MAPGLCSLSHSDTRKQVASSSSAGDDDFQGHLDSWGKFGASQHGIVVDESGGLTVQV